MLFTLLRAAYDRTLKGKQRTPSWSCAIFLARRRFGSPECFGPFGFLEADEVDPSFRIDEQRTLHEIAVC